MLLEKEKPFFPKDYAKRENLFLEKEKTHRFVLPEENLLEENSPKEKEEKLLEEVKEIQDKNRFLENHASSPVLFQIMASEKELLGKVTHIFKQHGFVAIWNQAGKMTFMMDGSKNPYQLCSTIEKLARKETHICEESVFYQDRSRLAKEVLMKHHFSIKLKGTQHLIRILVRLSYEPHLLHCMGKGVYAELTDAYACTAKIIDRSIRYAVDNSRLTGKNSTVIQRLFSEFLDLLGLNL